MIREQIMQMAESDPRYAQAVDAMEAQVARMPIVPEDLENAIQLLEFVLQNPDKYQEVRAAAIADGDIDPQMVPEQYDQVFVVSMLIALYGLQDRLKKQGYARGGLATAARRIAVEGRGGDTQLAHINPREAEMLRRMGGAGTVNPTTGLNEYKSGRQIFAALLPIALNFILPGIGGVIGQALGASGIGASILGGAIVGSASSAIGGGDWKKGALFGGLGGGLGSYAGGAASDALKLGLGETGKAILGGTLVGGAGGMLTGQGFAKGALQGAVGSGIGQLFGGIDGDSAFKQGVSNAGQTFGNALTSGYDPKTAATMGAASGVTAGFNYKPSDVVVDGLKTGAAPRTIDSIGGKLPDMSIDPTGAPLGSMDNVPATSAAEPSFWNKITKGGPLDSSIKSVGAKTDTGILGSGISAGNVLTGLSVLSSLQGAPDEAKQAVQQMSPTQQELFNRPSVSWDWNKMQNDANASNMSLSQFMATNWPKISGYASATPGAQQGAYNMQPAPSATPKMAQGGALSAVARFAQGAGSGRADTINAKLSDGEYVIDAETVAMLGDGSNKEGARRLDAMRGNIRSHKGKALARGKFSPNAKSPLSYLKGAA